jgi:hypothetical protein
VSIAYNIVPKGYDIDFIATYTGIEILGRTERSDGSTEIMYRNADGSGNFTRVSEAIENYAVDYLNIALARKIQQITAVRNERIHAFTFGGITIVLDLETKANIVGAVSGLERNPSVAGLDWSLGDGNFIFLPRDMVFAMADTAFNYVESCFTKAKDLVAECKAASNINDLDAIDIESDWPAGS